MDSRLKTSTKWTPIPAELVTHLEEVFREYFEDFDLKNGTFKVDGAIFPEEIILRVGLPQPHQLRCDNFELSQVYNAESDKVTEVIHNMADDLGIIWEDYLEDPPELIDLPLVWQPVADRKTSFYRYSSINAELEKQADILLQKYDKKLVYGEDMPIPNDTIINPENSIDELH